MTEALNTLAADKDMPEVQPVFITIDPDRDTPEKLQAYLQDFHPKLLGLTGTNAEVKAAVSIFQLLYVFFWYPKIGKAARVVYSRSQPASALLSLPSFQCTIHTIHRQKCFECTTASQLRTNLTITWLIIQSSCI